MAPRAKCVPRCQTDTKPAKSVRLPDKSGRHRAKKMSARDRLTFRMGCDLSLLGRLHRSGSGRRFRGGGHEFFFFESVAGRSAAENEPVACSTNKAVVRYRWPFEEVGGALDATNLASGFKSRSQTRAFGVLNEDHGAKENGDDQDEDKENVAHGVVFESIPSVQTPRFMGFSARPSLGVRAFWIGRQNKRFSPGISRPAVCKRVGPDPIAPVRHRSGPSFR